MNKFIKIDKKNDRKKRCIKIIASSKRATK